MPLSNGIKGEAVDMFHSLSKAKRLHHVHWACKDFQDGLNEIRMRHYLISKCRANVRLKLVEVDQHETNKSLDLFEKWIQILSGNSRQIKVKPTWNIVIQPMKFPQHIENHSLDAKPFTASTNWMTGDVFLAGLMQSRMRSTTLVMLPDCGDESIINWRFELWQAVANLFWWIDITSGQLLLIMNVKHLESSFDIMMPSSFELCSIFFKSQVIWRSPQRSWVLSQLLTDLPKMTTVEGHLTHPPFT